MRPATASDPPADLARLSDLVDLFPSQSILVLGDFVADQFVFGDISRVSREAPVLIIRRQKTELLPGGGANAANNLADLGATVVAVSALGGDESGNALRDYFRAKNISTSGLVSAPGWQTPTKTRFLAGWPHTARQQVLRVDSEPLSPFGDSIAKQLVRKAQSALKAVSGVLISDYGYGSASPEIAKAVCRGKGSAIPVALDSRYRLNDFRGLNMTAATPNEAELEAAFNSRIGADLDRLREFGQHMLAHLGLQALVVTRGRDGMMVFEKGRPPRPLPIFGSDQALDVTGAGDTVVAVLTLALAAGATVLEAAQLATYAAGIVVMKRGTATVTREELSAAIRSEVTGSAMKGNR